MDMFLENHNGKHPEDTLDSEKWQLVDKSSNVIDSDGNIGETVQEYQDLFVAEKKVVVEEETDPSLKRCCNPGCQQRYREEENHGEACRHHAKQPVFWDGGKFWACCPNIKKWEWEDFIAIPGCVMGPHSDVPPAPVAPEPMNNVPIKVDPAAPAPEPEACLECVEEEPQEEMVEVPEIQPDGSAVCAHHGCKLPFNVNDNPDGCCSFHPEAPIFHDGKKGYNCCNIHVYDFDDFMCIPCCATGSHTPTVKLVKKEEAHKYGLLDIE